MSCRLSSIVFLGCVATAVVRGGEQLNVAPNGSFEAEQKRLGGWLPIGVVPETGDYGIKIVNEVSRDGRRSLRISPGPAGVVQGTEYFSDHNGGEGSRNVQRVGGVRGARTIAMRLDRDLESVNARIWIRRSPHSDATCSLVWTTRRHRRPVVEIRRDSVTHASREKRGWELFELRAAAPRHAHQLQLRIETDATDPVFVDDVHLCLHRRPRVQLLVDQLGYPTRSPTKQVVLQSSRLLADIPAARVVDLRTSETVMTVNWSPKGYLPSWDRYHWVTDFSKLRRPGTYAVALQYEGEAIASDSFSIGDNLLEQHAAELAHRFYYYQRCGTEVPGFHAACHLDDARLPDGSWKDLTGGWHDAGDYNKYIGLTPEAVRALAFAYHRKPDLFDRWDRDGNGRADILDEAWWGARFVRKMLDVDSLNLLESVFSGYRYWGPPEKETDNRPGTEDDRPVREGQGDRTHCVAGFALLGKYLVDDKTTSPEAIKAGREYLEIAQRMYEKWGGSMESLIALYESTGRGEHRRIARRRAEELLRQQGDDSAVGFRELAYYAIAFPDDPLVERIKPLAARRVAELQMRCDERFGVLRIKSAGGKLVYCRPYADVNDWYVGQTSTRLDGAIDGLLAARLGEAPGRVIAENQVHWLLGRNAVGLSMVEGVGKRFLPQYHHRYNAIEGNPRGAVPGALINGFIRAWPAVDRPWLDLWPEPNADYHCNEPWLLHNNRWLTMIALW